MVAATDSFPKSYLLRKITYIQYPNKEGCFLVLVNVGQVPFDYVRQNELVHVRAYHTLCVVVAWKKLFDDRDQQPEGVFLLHEYQLIQ
jgi:hypothetical protein